MCQQKGLTALLAATSASHTDVVKLLLERGADINAVDHVSHPLHCLSAAYISINYIFTSLNSWDCARCSWPPRPAM